MLMVVMMSILLPFEMANPDIVTGERKRCAEQCAKQPKDAGHDSAETAGVDCINPSAKLISLLGISIESRGRNLTCTTVELIAISCATVAGSAECHRSAFRADGNLWSIRILGFQLVIDLLPTSEF